ncbi:hypothetical protein DPMN_145290 [Dreissena polymorpha]|uniref:Uncharacterized protein n=1 Tax=Dreissena polymorpha TaxID=45954 RepID=A0A9D4F3Q1_DREPO|nr:hypothetical protein DPMN_145290 [Dreissena polymorpha]
MKGSDTTISAIEAGAGAMNEHVIRGKGHIKSAVMDGSDVITGLVEASTREISSQVDVAKREIRKLKTNILTKITICNAKVRKHSFIHMKYNFHFKLLKLS